MKKFSVFIFVVVVMVVLFFPSMGATFPCDSNDDCNDGDGSTVGSCNLGSGVCVFDFSCVDDACCDDGVFCNGEERCHISGSCLPGTPPVCDDGIQCTDDACDEDAGACQHIVPDMDGDLHFDINCKD